MALMPRESGKLIAKLAKSVHIEPQGVKSIANEILEGIKSHTVSVDNFSQSNLHPNANDPRATDWIFVLDTLNFSFWNNQRWLVNGYSGYFALCAAIKRALESNVPIYDPKFYANIQEKELEDILRPDEGSAPVPMIPERVQNLRQVGRILIDKYNGTFLECVKKSGNSAERLLKLIVGEFECYRDEANFHGNKVSFYKRAQILVGDIWACFKGKGLGAFPDIGVITMFADYRVPQVLIHFGALRYSNSLVDKLRCEDQLQAGCDEEIEIRGCSIEVVERVLEEVKRLDPSVEVNTIMIDHFLWDFRRAHATELESIPYHKTRTIYY